MAAWSSARRRWIGGGVRVAMRRCDRHAAPRSASGGDGQRDWLQPAGDWRVLCDFKFQISNFKSPKMSSRVILITGANGALGEAIARAFLAESPQNIVWLGVHSNRANAEDLSRENAGRCRLVDLDVTSPAAWQKAVHCVLGEDQRLDVLV